MECTTFNQTNQTNSLNEFLTIFSQLLGEDQYLAMYKDLPMDRLTFVYSENMETITVCFEGGRKIFPASGDFVKDAVLVYHLGTTPAEDRWTSQMFTLKHKIEGVSEQDLKKTFSSVESIGKNFEILMSKFSEQLGTKIPQGLRDLIKHVCEVAIIGFMSKNFLRECVRLIAVKLTVYCVDIGLKILNIVHVIKSILSSLTFKSQGIIETVLGVDEESFSLEDLFKKCCTKKALIIPVIFTFVSAIFTKLFTDEDPKEGFLTNMWNEFSKIPAKTKKLTERVTDIINFIGVFFDLNIGKNAVKKSCAKLQKELLEMIKIKDNFDGNSRGSDEIAYTLEMAQKAFGLYEQSIDLNAKCEKYKLKEEAAMLRTVKPQIEILMKHYAAHTKYLQKPRKVPIFVILRGKPGGGKTQFLNALSTMASHIHKPDLKGSREVDSFSPAQNSEYYDGYDPTVTSWIFDDLGTMADSATKPDPTFACLINMVNNAPFPLNMSKAEEKGKVFFSSPFIFASTNQERWNIKSINNPDALARRTFLDIRVEPNPEYVEDYYIGNTIAQKVSIAKIDAKNVAEGKQPGQHRPDASLYFVKTNQSAEEKQMSFEEIMRMIANEYYRIAHSINTKESTELSIKSCVDELKDIEARFKSQMLESFIRPNFKGLFESQNEEVSVEVEEEEEDEYFYDDELPSPFGEPEQFSFGSYYSDEEEQESRITQKIEFNNRFLEFYHKVTKPTNIDSIKQVKTKIESIFKTISDKISKVCKSAFNSYCKLWTESPWKAALLSALPPLCIGLAFWLRRVFSGKHVSDRDAIFGVNVISNNDGWEPITTAMLLGGFTDQIQKRNSAFRGKKMYLEEIRSDAYCARLIQIYATKNVDFKLAVMKKDLPKLRDIKNLLSTLQELDIPIIEGEPKLAESRIYSKENNVQIRHVEDKTYNKENIVQIRQVEDKTYNKDNNIQIRKVENKIYHLENVVQTRKVEMKNEDDNMEQLKTLYSEGVTDVTADNLMRNRVPTNLCRISIFDDDEKIGSMNLFMLKGRVGMTASHLLNHQFNNIELNFANKHPLKFDTSELIIHVDEKRDLLFITFPNRMECFKDLTKHFLKKDDLRNMILCRGALCSIDHERSIHYVSSGNIESLFTDYQIDTESENIAGEKQITRRRLDGLFYHIETHDGDCGGPIILMNDKLPRKIAGIHIAGKNKETGLASIVTQEYLEQIFDDVPYSSQIHFDISKVVDFEDCDMKELLENAPCTGVTMLGKIKNPPRQPTKTNIEKSILHGVFEVETEPCHLRNFDGIDIFKLNSKKISLETKKIDEELLRDAVNDVCKVLNGQRDISLIRVLTPEEAISGIDGCEFVDGLKRQTSAGFPYVRFADGGGKRKWLGSDGEYIYNQDVLELMDIIRENAKHFERTPNIFVDSLKDERLPKEKVKVGKTRIFSCGDFIHTAVMRQYTLGFTANMMRHRIENESGVGIDVHTEWGRLAKFLQRDNKTKFVAGDFSGFDGTLNSQILYGVLDVIEDFYYNSTEEERIIRYVLFTDLVNSLRLQNGYLYGCDHSQPSGNPLTVIINTIYNMIAIRLVYMICKKNADVRGGVKDFRKLVNFVAYGDDNLYGIDDTIIDWFNQHTITEGFDAIGMIYTDEAKTLDGNIPPYRSLSDVGFLKRKFVKDSNIWMCPIAERTIRELCNWTKKSVDNVQASIDNIEDAFKEAYYYGPKYYEEFTNKVNKAYLDYAVKNKISARLEIEPYSVLRRQHADKIREKLN